MAQKKTMGLRKNLREQERREAIIQSAIKVFARMGYDRATMDDVVSEAGCSKALVYLYWKNKAELFLSLLDLCGKQYSDFFHGMLESTDPFEEKLTAFFSQFVELFNKNIELNKVSHHGSLYMGHKPDENFRSSTESYYRDYIGTLSAFFRQGIDLGYLDPDLDVEALAFMAVAAVEGYIYMSIIAERMPPERAFVDIMNKYILPMMIKKEKESL
ncbi:MAG: TetR/AcrR family transcriptional regulator [Deltaproteobacteria bacterium]|nr:TetR/AcrR family transcriptional regulator [Deltaproteobacteria bacterium]